MRITGEQSVIVLVSRPTPTDLLTCCDNKKQQTDVELHFQSGDISFILHPYRFTGSLRCDEDEQQRKVQFSPRTVPTKTGVRDFPSPSLPPNGNRRCQGRSLLNETHVCPVMYRRVDTEVRAASGLLRWILWHLRRLQERIQHLGFYARLISCTGNLHRRTHEDMRGRRHFITSAPHRVGQETGCNPLLLLAGLLLQDDPGKLTGQHLLIEPWTFTSLHVKSSVSQVLLVTIFFCANLPINCISNALNVYIQITYPKLRSVILIYCVKQLVNKQLIKREMSPCWGPSRTPNGPWTRLWEPLLKGTVASVWVTEGFPIFIMCRYVHWVLAKRRAKKQETYKKKDYLLMEERPNETAAITVHLDLDAFKAAQLITKSRTFSTAPSLQILWWGTCTFQSG